MSERITIDVVSEEDQWSNEYGTYQAYMLDVKTEDGRIVGNVQSNRKIKDDGSHNEPREGEEVWGTLESKKGGSYKLTLDTKRMKDEPLSGGSYEASTGTSASSQNSSKGQSKGDVDWDVRNAEIRRQHSQEQAIRLSVLLHDAAPESMTVQDFKAQIVAFADWFDQDAISAGRKAVSGDEASKHETPVDLSGARTEEPIPPKPSVNFHKDELPNQDLDDYRQLLWNAGLEPAAARDKCAEFMGVVLPKDRLDKAVSGLQDLDRQGTVLAQLKAETERWIKGPRPQGDAAPADDIPFARPEYREPGYERMRWRF